MPSKPFTPMDHFWLSYAQQEEVIHCLEADDTESAMTAAKKSNDHLSSGIMQLVEMKNELFPQEMPENGGFVTKQSSDGMKDPSDKSDLMSDWSWKDAS